MVRPPVTYATVEPIWRGETAVIVAGGPSLTQEDVDACRGRARVIVVNDGYRMAPWADLLYACDWGWWRRHEPNLTSFAGLRYALENPSHKYLDGVSVLKNTGIEGLETDPSALKNGRNSGYQAINLAVHLGVSRIVLLGYDMQRSAKGSHWFGEHPNHQGPPLGMFIPLFAELAPLLRKRGIDVVNCSRETALKCFPRAAISDALAVQVAA